MNRVLDYNEELALPTLLSRLASERADVVFMQDTNGTSLTFHEVEQRIRWWMGLLGVLRVRPGDRVAVFIPTSIDSALIWMAVARYGSIEVPINADYRGPLLEHVIKDAQPRLVITCTDYLQRLSDICGGESPAYTTYVVDAQESISTLGLSSIYVEPTVVPLDTASRALKEYDISSVVYTSGTSGASKGVLVPWGQQYATATWCMPLNVLSSEDAWYGPWPMNHVSGKLGLYVSALVGGRWVVRPKFSTSNFWKDVDQYRCSITMLVPSALSYLWAAERKTSDRSHSLRFVFGGPWPRHTYGFGERFNVRMATCFNMTELSAPIVTDWLETEPVMCGRTRPGFECRVVDEYDREVPDGVIGELVVRAEHPWEMMAGYYAAPEATVAAWRNLWFHTGDAVCRQADGEFRYIDRLQYTIRVGGENVSGSELESIVESLAGIDEAAAIGVPSQSGEQEIKLFIVTSDGRPMNGAGLYRALQPKVPKFMLPRFIQQVDSIPRTDNLRAKKEELRRLPGSSVFDTRTAISDNEA